MPSSSTHPFRKLRLDTTTSSSAQCSVHSPLSSIHRHNGSSETSALGKLSADQHDKKSTGHVDAPRLTQQTQRLGLGSCQLADVAGPGRGELSRLHESVRTEAVTGEEVPECGLPTEARQRGLSISFDPQVRLEDGGRRNLDDPFRKRPSGDAVALGESEELGNRSGAAATSSSLEHTRRNRASPGSAYALPSNSMTSSLSSIPSRPKQHTRQRSNSETETRHFDETTGARDPPRERYGPRYNHGIAEGYFSRAVGRHPDHRCVAAEEEYHQGEMRHPLLQSTVDDLSRGGSMENLDVPMGQNGEEALGELGYARFGGGGRGNLLRKGTGESHGTPFMNNSLRSSVTTSPTDISLPSGGSGSGSGSGGSGPRMSRRSVSSRSIGSAGSVGRRRTIKSNPSSLSSPASAFLGNFTTTRGVGGEPMAEPEPDDEGQQIPESEYIIGRKIGHGGFSVVREVSTMEDYRWVVRAAKIVRKNIRGRDETENERLQAEFAHEVDIWRCLRHPYILELIAVYESDFATFCITRLTSSGTLYDVVRERRKSGLPKDKQGLEERLAKRYSFQLASALRFLHEDRHIVHRDVKLENCLLDKSDPDSAAQGGTVLLCDFGMADFIHNENRSGYHQLQHQTTDNHHHHHPLEHAHISLTTPIATGSPHTPLYAGDGGSSTGLGPNVGPSNTSTTVMGSAPYIAPELTCAVPVYSTCGDVWAYGCVVYALLTGRLPFEHEFTPLLNAMIAKGEYDHELLLKSPTVRGDEGHAVMKLVASCLAVDVAERWAIGTILECAWFEGCVEEIGRVEENSR